MCFFWISVIWYSGPILILISMSFFLLLSVPTRHILSKNKSILYPFSLIKTAIFTILSGFIAGFSVEIQGFERVQNR